MLRWTTVLFLLLSALNTWAYQTHFATGEILKPNEYRTGLNAQFITTEFSGATANGLFDWALQKDSEIRFAAGAGKVDYHFGGFLKWVPFPDLENQPAIGLMTGPIYARINGKGYFTLKATPFLSKKFESEQAGWLTPYGGIPLGLEVVDGATNVPSQLMFGCDWKPANLETVHFQIEAGLNLSKSFSYIAFGSIIHFDMENGFRIR